MLPGIGPGHIEALRVGKYSRGFGSRRRAGRSQAHRPARVPQRYRRCDELAIHPTSPTTTPSVGGRPGRLGSVHLFRTRRWCQRRIVPGVTRRWPRSFIGSRRMSAAKTARSAQSRRGARIGAAEHGDLVAQHQQLDVLGCTPCVPTARPGLSTCRKIRYSNRSDTAAIMPDHRKPLDHRWSATCSRVLEPHRG